MASNEAWQGWPYHIASVFAEMEVQSEINSVFPLSFAYLPYQLLPVTLVTLHLFLPSEFRKDQPYSRNLHCTNTFTQPNQIVMSN